MFFPARSFRSFVAIVLLCLAGCGGGGGGSSSSNSPPPSNPPPTNPPPTDPPPTNPPPTDPPPTNPPPTDPTDTNPPTQPPLTPVDPAVSVSVSESTVPLGQSIQLAWSTEGVESCNASGDWSGPLPLSGNTTVRPLLPTNTYAVSCDGPNGSAAEAVTVLVDDQRPISVHLDSDLDAVVVGGDLIISWSTVGATSCTASGSWSGPKPLRGYEIRGPIIEDAQFILSCTGPTGSASDTATVLVLQAPTLVFSARDPEVYEGESATLDWSSNHSTTCHASLGWSGLKSPAGSEVTPPLTQDTDFGLTCEGPGGSVSATVTVEVSPPPEPELIFSAAETTVPFGAITILRWTAVRLSSCVATGGWSGAREPEGNEPVGPLEENQIYSLECLGPDGLHTASVEVVVVPRPPSEDESEVTLLDAAFVEIVGRPDHEGYFPLNSEPVVKDGDAVLLVHLSGSPASADATLVDDLGDRIATVSLSPFTETLDDSDFLGAVAVPATRFTLEISGLDVLGRPYIVTTRQFNPVTFALELPLRRVELGPGESLTLPFTITNFGQADTFAVEFSSPYVISGATSVGLAADESRELSLVLGVPASVQRPWLERVDVRISPSSDPSKVNVATMYIDVEP